MPGLDGLRAIAVTAVLLYHAQVSGFDGGFLGVEVFFVISGYLITALLLAEWGGDQRIDLKNFWLRRARRLLPALFLLLIVTMIVAIIFVPDEVASLRGDVAAAFLYVANWNFVIVGKSYFEAMGRPSLVRHLWSLAVEEQFYLVWPLLFTGGMRWFGRRIFMALIVFGAIGSTALMWVLYVPGEDPSRIYYGTDTRAAGLLIGCLLAFLWSPWRLKAEVGRYGSAMLDIIGAVALVVLGVMLYTVDEFSDSLYRGGFAKLSLVTAVVIAVVVHPAARLGRVIGIAPLKWIGLRSYGIYLWHWPIFQLTRPGQDIDLDGFPLLALRFGLTLIVAELSFRFVEMPVRNGALGRWWKKLRSSWKDSARTRIGWSGAGLVSTAALVVLVIAVVTAVPPAPPGYLAFADGTTTEGMDPSRPFQVPVVTTSSTSSTTTTAPPGVPVTEAPPPTIPLLPATNRFVVAIGDSVMLGAASQLVGLSQATVVDAVVGRQAGAGTQVAQIRKDTGELGDIVIVHLGNNGTFTDAQFDALMVPLAEVPAVIFVNVRVPRRWEASVNETLAKGVPRYPNAYLMDWYNLSANQPIIFWNDGMHLRPEGARFYVDRLAEMIRTIGLPNLEVPATVPTTAPPPPPPTEPPPPTPEPAPAPEPAPVPVGP